MGAARIGAAMATGAIGPMKDEVDCPACGRATLTHAGGREVCPVCGWEDDPAQRENPRSSAGDNGISLEEARANVSAFGQAFPPSEVGV